MFNIQLATTAKLATPDATNGLYTAAKCVSGALGNCHNVTFTFVRYKGAER